jgi:hypothetical protein
VQRQTGEKVLELGATAMLAKPASKDAVRALLERALGGASHA